MVALARRHTGVNASEFSQAILAAAQEDWEDRQDAHTGRTYYLNTLTGTSSWDVIGVEYVPTFLELSGLRSRSERLVRPSVVPDVQYL